MKLLTLASEPVPKARAKTIMRNGKVWTFTPKGTQDAQNELKWLIQQQIAGTFPAYTPVSLAVTFYRTKPTYTPKGDTIPVRKPDLDNYIKTILDALDGLAFPDDAQVSSILARKRWVEEGKTGYITVELKEDEL